MGEGQVLNAGTQNPFSVLGMTSVEISIEPKDAKISCDVIAVAFLFCEEVSTKLGRVYQVIITQWLAWRLVTGEVLGSNHGKGEN